MVHIWARRPQSLTEDFRVFLSSSAQVFQIRSQPLPANFQFITSQSSYHWSLIRELLTALLNNSQINFAPFPFLLLPLHISFLLLIFSSPPYLLVPFLKGEK
jgi:hypothetical protein